MRVLLDNCVNHRFANFIIGHEVAHARSKGWSELKNGELIAAAEADGFSAIITTDKRMQYQQSLKDRKISIVVLASRRITLTHLTPLADRVIATLDNLPEGSFVIISEQ